MAPLASAQVAVTAEFRADEAPPHRLVDMCGLTFQPERITGLDVDGLPPTVQLLVAARTDLVAPGHLARLRERGEMDAAAVFDQPVGVKPQAGSFLRQLQLGSLEGLPAQSRSQGQGDGHVGERDRSVGADERGPHVTGTRRGAVAGDWVVDRVETGGFRDPRPVFPTRLVLVDPGDQLVEVGEELIGRQVQGGEVVDGGAQSAHGGRRVQPMADHVTDHQGDPGPGKGDDVEPVPAHPGLRGPVPVGDLQGGLFGQVITVTVNWRFRNRRSTAASLVVGRPPAA